MTRRKTFDADGVKLSFWRRDDVRLALARREVGTLFAIYLGAHPECTQTQLALLTEHDRSDISNFVRGTRSSRVTDIDVLGRIADGLVMPDEARVLLGLAPVEAPMATFRTTRAATEPQDEGRSSTTTGWFRPPEPGRPLRMALCGSRPPGADNAMINQAVAAVSRLLMNRACEVDHGPMGIGMEIMTYIADHYRPPTLQSAVGLFGRSNVVRNADYVLVIGGGLGTLDEVDLAISMGKRLVPFGASGGAARHALERMGSDLTLRSWLPEDEFATLQDCVTAADYTTVVEQIISTNLGSARSE